MLFILYGGMVYFASQSQRWGFFRLIGYGWVNWGEKSSFNGLKFLEKTRLELINYPRFKLR
jgi:hypothetical protein